MSRIFASGFFLLLFLLLAACSITNELTESERSVLFSELDFASMEVKVGKKPVGEYEKLVDYANSSTDFSYVKDSEVGDAGFYLQSTVIVERSRKNRLVSELSEKAGTAIGIKLGGYTEESLKLSGRYGSGAKLSLLKMEGKPVGNSFTAVVDSKIVSLFFVGVYFDKAEDFEAFIEPKMAKVKAFKVG